MVQNGCRRVEKELFLCDVMKYFGTAKSVWEKVDERYYALYATYCDAVGSQNFLQS